MNAASDGSPARTGTSKTVQPTHRKPPAQLGGANPERTSCVPVSRHDTHEYKPAAQSARDGTRRHQPRARVHVRDEEVVAESRLLRSQGAPPDGGARGRLSRPRRPAPSTSGPVAADGTRLPGHAPATGPSADRRPNRPHNWPARRGKPIRKAGYYRSDPALRNGRNRFKTRLPASYRNPSGGELPAATTAIRGIVHGCGSSVVRVRLQDRVSGSGRGGCDGVLAAGATASTRRSRRWR